MPSFFNFSGYTAPDPLDKASGSIRTLLAVLVTAAITVILILAITEVWRIIDYTSLWMKIAQVGIFALVFAPLVVLLRKSSSLVLWSLPLLPLLLVDLYLETHVRAVGKIAPWTYYPGAFLGAINPPVLHFLIGASVDAFLIGPFSLWLTRLLAHFIYRNQPDPDPTPEQRDALFPDEWTNESVEKPDRDAGYWILRLLGLGYLIYLLLLIIGTLGTSAWPAQLADLMTMTYKNPALAMNTFGKVGIMVLLAFAGAYNVALRWHATLVLAIGHFISTIGSLGFYFFSAPGTEYRDFLLTSAIVDGVMVLLFGYILIRYRNEASKFGKVKTFPAFFSVPAFLSRALYYLVAVVALLLIVQAVVARLFCDADSGLGAVYGYPNPLLTNTITAYGAVGLIAFLLATREKLREYLTGIMLYPLFAGLVACAGWFVFSSEVLIATRTGGAAEVDQYFMIYFVGNLLAIALIISFRRMYYSVEYIITTLHPSEARNAMAIYEAFYGATTEDQALALRNIDRFAGNIRGRKRGLVNFPFWIFEHVLNFIYGLRPFYASMSRDECRYFLRKYILRLPKERARALVPVLADIAYMLGVSVQALTTFAHYENIKNTHAVGYVPPDARDRLKTDYPESAPPFQTASSLPADQNDPNNYVPDTPTPPVPLLARRLATPISEPDLPSEVDYLILGSGAGGAVMAYRLASDPSVDAEKILMVERGGRYSPLQDINDKEMEMIAKLYKEGGLQQTKNFDMIILQGECVGGTTVVNNAVCFPMGASARTEWQNTFDIDLSGIDSEYDLIADELGIAPLDDLAINREVRDRFLDGVNGYNQDADKPLQLENPLRVNARNAVGDGLWNLGNKRMRKRSMLESYIPWAEAHGVKVVSNTTGVRFLSSGPQADAVLLRSSTGDLKEIKVNKAVVVAGGCIASSHFLMRSGVRGNVGQHLCCNFAFPVAFGYEDELRAFDGVQITVGALDPDERAVFETYYNPPAAFSLSIPFFFGENDDIMTRYVNYVNFGALVGSDDSGVVEIKSDFINGRAFTWQLTNRDIERIRYAFATLLKIGQKSGATHAVLPTRPGISFELTESNVQRFITALNDYPLRIRDLLINTAHPQGGNRMTGDNSSRKSTRVVDGHFRVDGFDNVYVADASLFPVSIGVNPQWTIMAMSSLAAKQVLGA